MAHNCIQRQSSMFSVLPDDSSSHGCERRELNLWFSDQGTTALLLLHRYLFVRAFPFYVKILFFFKLLFAQPAGLKEEQKLSFAECFFIVGHKGFFLKMNG